MNLDEKLVTQCLFHPRGEDRGYVPQGIPTETSCDGAVICGFLHESHASDTLLLFFHGNGEIAADYDTLYPLFTNCGVSFWVVDYRGYGRSTGTPSFSNMLRDAEAVLDDVPRLAKVLGRTFRHIIVMGRSLGSASAIHLASTKASVLKGLILDSPYANGLRLIQRLGGPLLKKQNLPQFQDNSDKMSQCHLPTLIIHGSKDQIIPIADSETLWSVCCSPQKDLIKIEGAGHNNLLRVGLTEYCSNLYRFVAGIRDI